MNINLRVDIIAANRLLPEATLECRQSLSMLSGVIIHSINHAFPNPAVEELALKNG